MDILRDTHSMGSFDPVSIILTIFFLFFKVSCPGKIFPLALTQDIFDNHCSNLSALVRF